MHRPTVAAIALFLIGGVVYFYFIPPISDDTIQVGFQAAFNRLAILMSCLWLALPQVSRIPPRLIFFIIITIMIILIVLKPRHLFLIVPIIIALWHTRHWTAPPDKLPSRKT